ncbi:MAG: type II toxin-antitoxin system RelE/ParE family toxin [Armatimonadetes bacterium]|nr:type II toxin-antitoxin system RelE/ParE family toxin [Armatimonadota bacterium]
MLRIRWSLQAVDDLEPVPLAAHRQILAIIELLRRMPRMGAEHSEIPGKRAFRCGNYYIVYRIVSDERIEINRIQDCRRGDRVI